MRNFTVIVTLLVAVSAHAQTPKEFIAAMKARRDGITTAKYELEVTTHQIIVPDPIKHDLVESKQKPVVKRYTLELDLRRGWTFEEVRGEEYKPIQGGGLVIRPMHGCTTFHDGLMRTIQWPIEGSTAVGNEPGRASDYAEVRGDLSQQLFTFQWQPAFAHLGLLPLNPRLTLSPGQFHQVGPNDDDDDLLGEPAGRSEPGKKVFECLQATGTRTGRKVEILVDSRVPNRVLQLTKTMHPTVDRIECKYSGDALQSWEHRTTMLGKLLYTSSYRVLSCRLNEPIADDRYRLSPDPGMVVRKIDQHKDPRQSTAESFKVTPSGGLESITTDFDRPPVDRPTSHTVWWWIAGATLGGAVVAALVLVWRRRNRRPSLRSKRLAGGSASGG